jgi:hypothetical protein
MLRFAQAFLSGFPLLPGCIAQTSNCVVVLAGRTSTRVSSADLLRPLLEKSEIVPCWVNVAPPSVENSNEAGAAEPVLVMRTLI